MRTTMAFMLLLGIQPLTFDASTSLHLAGFAITPSKILFEKDEILNLTLKGDINSLFKDRGDKTEYHPMNLSYTAEDSSIVSCVLRVKTRGHFRRDKLNCTYPPLLLNFSKDKTPPGSLFEHEHKLKLVTPCADDKYVIREYLVYKLYNLITDKSLKARLVRVVYDDTVKNKKTKPLYGILLESEESVIQRNNAVIIEKKIVKPFQTESDTFLKTAVFEYMIGNTDWSVQYRQNIILMAADSLAVPFTVPYDFDHSGIVSAPYAKPAEALMLSSTHQRRYRGYCIGNFSKFSDVFALFNQEKSNIYRLYTENKLLDEKYITSTLQFLDDFYETINDEQAGKKAFSYPCNKDGTGNVVIKGLDKKE